MVTLNLKPCDHYNWLVDIRYRIQY